MFKKVVDSIKKLLDEVNEVTRHHEMIFGEFPRPLKSGGGVGGLRHKEQEERKETAASAKKELV